MGFFSLDDVKIHFDTNVVLYLAKLFKTHLIDKNRT